MKKQLIFGVIAVLLFSGSLYTLAQVGAFDNFASTRLGAGVIGAFTSDTYNIRPSTKTTGVFTFNYKFEKVTPIRGQVIFDIPRAQFDEKIACKELQKFNKEQPCDFGKYRDDKGYPVHENAYQIQWQNMNQNSKTSLNPFHIEKALASDDDPTTLGLVNCRANTSVTGYFKAYFEDVALNNNVNYDDPTYGQARRDEACQVLQDISILIKLNTTTVTPDILFMKDPGNIPANALAVASAYTGSYSVGPDNGTLHKYIVSHQNPTPNTGSFDAFVMTNFNGVQWDVDSTLNAGTYDFYTVIYHEILHTLGFRGLLPATITSTGDAHTHGTFDSFTYKDSTLAQQFFSSLTGFLQVPVGAPSSWFITNTAVYRGVKNIVGATPDGIHPIFSPLSWQQGSSLSHFDMDRSSGQTYVMHPSITTNTSRIIHNGEKEALCHAGYMVNGMTGCGQATPLAVDDSLLMSGTSMCIQPLVNDISFAGGNLTLQSVTPITLQTGDVLTYYTSTDCTSGSQPNALNVKSIKITFGSSPYQRIMQYANKDSISNRISFETTITLDPVLACQDVYHYVAQWGSFGNADGQFYSAAGIATDSFGNVYVVNGSAGNDPRVQKFTSNGAYITQWGSSGSGDGQFYDPLAIAVDSSNNVYVSDTLNNRIQKFTSNGTYITQWGIQGYGSRNIAVDSFDNVYVADVGNSRIQKFTSNGTYITQWGTQGTGDGQFSGPSGPLGLAIDSSNNVYVADFNNRRIQKFTSSGIYITQWASILNGQLYFPSDIAVDSSDNVFVAGYTNSRVQKLTSSGTHITQWGSWGFGDGQFTFPIGIAVDDSSNVYVNGGTVEYRIQKFSPSCDVCSNLTGIQSVVPDGYQLTGGQCILQPISISGKVYNDTNINGSLNNSESGLDGVSVKLFAQGSSTPIQTTMTQNIPNLGEYSFSNIPNGNYYVALGNESIYPSITEPLINNPILISGYSYVRQEAVSSGQNNTNNNFGVMLAGNDLCWNIDGVQTVIPSGYQVDDGNKCTEINPVDMCPNLTGTQSTIPSGYQLGATGDCVQIDLCSNIQGIQTSVPTGYQIVGSECLPLPDMCSNISGIQVTVPAGYVNIGSMCFTLMTNSTDTKITDLCPNISGTQATIPSGYQLVNGQCMHVIVTESAAKE